MQSQNNEDIMQRIGGLQALKTKMLQETCCVTGGAIGDDGRPAIVKIERVDGTIMTISGKVAKKVRKGTKFYLGGKVASIVRKNVVMEIKRNRRGTVYADCSAPSSPIRVGKGSLKGLKSLPEHIQRNIIAKRGELAPIWAN